MAVKRAHISDDDARFVDGPCDDSMSSTDSTVTESPVGYEDACQSGRRTAALSTKAESLIRRTSKIMRNRVDGYECACQSGRRTAILSTEAESLIRRTSKIIRNRGDGKAYRVPEPLVRQLTFLRNLVPYSSPQRKDSCVIADALTYLDQLSKQVHKLQMEFSDVISPFSENHSKVEVTAGERGTRIHVSCQKRPGLMADLITELERLGIVFQELKVSNHETFVLDAVSSQAEGRPVDTDVIKQQVWRLLLQEGTWCACHVRSHT